MCLVSDWTTWPWGVRDWLWHFHLVLVKSMCTTTTTTTTTTTAATTATTTTTTPAAAAAAPTSCTWLWKLQNESKTMGLFLGSPITPGLELSLSAIYGSSPSTGLTRLLMLFQQFSASSSSQPCRVLAKHCSIWLRRPRNLGLRNVKGGEWSIRESFLGRGRCADGKN